MPNGRPASSDAIVAYVLIGACIAAVAVVLAANVLAPVWGWLVSASSSRFS